MKNVFNLFKNFSTVALMAISTTIPICSQAQSDNLNLDPKSLENILALVNQSPHSTEILKAFDQVAIRVLNSYLPYDQQIGQQQGEKMQKIFVATNNSRKWEEYVDKKAASDISLQEQFVYNSLKGQIASLRQELLIQTRIDSKSYKQSHDQQILNDIKVAESISSLSDSSIRQLESSLKEAMADYAARVIYPKVRFRTFTIASAIDIPWNPSGKLSYLSQHMVPDTFTRGGERCDIGPSDYQLALLDSNGIVRFNYVYKIRRGYRNPKCDENHSSISDFVYFGNSGSSRYYFRAVTNKQLPQEAHNQLAEFLKTVSIDCPVRITIDTESGLASKFEFKCDPFRP